MVNLLNGVLNWKNIENIWNYKIIFKSNFENEFKNPYFTGNSFAILLLKFLFLQVRQSQSLFYWKLFCNMFMKKNRWNYYLSQSLFYWKLFCNEFIELYGLNMILSQSLFYWKLFCNTFAETYCNENHLSQSLFYWKLFCNKVKCIILLGIRTVTILILLETLLQCNNSPTNNLIILVTILILLETLLQ